MPRPLTEADRAERARMLCDEEWKTIPAPINTPSIPRPGTVRRIPTRPGLWARLIRLINWSKK